MTALNKCALRQLAEKAGGEEWQSRKEPGIGSEYTVIVKGSLKKNQGWSTCRPVAEQVVNKKTMDFISAANPAVVLALLDGLEAAEKRIAELESNEIRDDGNQFLVVRHPGKTPVIKHWSGDPEEFLRNLIEQDPLVTIDIITHRYYGVGGQWVQDADEYLHMMAAAGIGVKGE
ncbi:ead/Ea22-like family protein [Citrobacter sp. wls615]|uniref:ead/Ea22-like family protein n=1 Tax=Citrobacter sp. wls615 TaxID=2576435 RepID=UPI0010C9D4B4|nr:ead/Ea22-like family protein [Citrobacter sp. wls615]TKV15578.1 ead/Ea22-like family protein [Citrobacter sp. wls615]